MMEHMTTNRRDFLKTAAIGLAALGANEFIPRPAAGLHSAVQKNWVWIPNNLATRSADDWKARLALMRQSGIRAILPEIYDGREAYFASTRLPVKSDWLGTLLPLALAEGLEVHAWMWSMPCMVPEIMQKHPDWYNVNALGESAVDKPAYVPYYRFLDPGRPEVREWVQGTVNELSNIPDLTGVHLDYIRHPDAILPVGLWSKYNLIQDHVFPQFDYGYSEYEREQFKKKHGIDPLQIPNSKNTKLQQEWLQARWDMVTDLVNGYLVPAAHAKGKMITAAVFPGPTMAREHVRQDWGKWHLDAYLPMLYNSFYNAGADWVGEETREGVHTVKKPIYSGIFLGNMDQAALTQVVQAARKGGASGVSLFCESAMEDEKWAMIHSALQTTS
jgi:uncharacterized lipoprotein YddW (UPF0748 family)